MDNKEILTKLRKLEELLAENKRLDAYMKEGSALEAIDRIENLKNDLGSLPGVPAVVNAMPVFPPEGAEYKKAKDETAQSSKLLMIALAATAVLFVIYLLSKAVFFGFLAVIGGVVSFVINKTHKLNKEGLAKKEKAYNQAVEESRKSMEAFHTALAVYTQEAEQGMAAAKQYGQRYRQKYDEYMGVLNDFEKNKNEALMQYSFNQVEIKEHDYIPEQYHHHVPKLIAMLQSGRADSYKEALNMAIQEEREEAAEAARQEEEARRLAAMERQAEEERRHNMMMERQQAAHNRAMEQAERDRADAQRREALQAKRDQERAARTAREKEMDAHNKALHRCSKCSKRFACSVRGNPNCGAFDPDPIFRH